jgi:hypothetical protein
MDLEQAIGVIQAAMSDLAEQLARPRDLLHFHQVRAAHSTYQVLLGLLTPVRDLIGPEIGLQRAYLEGMAGTCEGVAALLRQAGGGEAAPR